MRFSSTKSTLSTATAAKVRPDAARRPFGLQVVFLLPNTDAENATHAIIDWCAANGVPGGMIYDGLTHFKNETVRLVSKGLKTPHHFPLPFCPWSNGAVKRLGRVLPTSYPKVAHLKVADGPQGMAGAYPHCKVGPQKSCVYAPRKFLSHQGLYGSRPNLTGHHVPAL